MGARKCEEEDETETELVRIFSESDVCDKISRSASLFVRKQKKTRPTQEGLNTFDLSVGDCSKTKT